MTDIDILNTGILNAYLYCTIEINEAENIQYIFINTLPFFNPKFEQERKQIFYEEFCFEIFKSFLHLDVTQDNLHKISTLPSSLITAVM